MENCSVAGCDLPIHVRKRHLCRRHYMLWWKYGDPTYVTKEGDDELPCGHGCGRTFRTNAALARHEGSSCGWTTKQHDEAKRRRGEKHRAAREARKARIRTIATRRRQLLVEQGGRCAICGTDDPGRPPQNDDPVSAWCLDHDHNLEHVCRRKSAVCPCDRGVLCAPCNAHLVPALEYREEHLDAARAYLARSRTEAEVQLRIGRPPSPQDFVGS